MIKTSSTSEESPSSWKLNNIRNESPPKVNNIAVKTETPKLPVSMPSRKRVQPQNKSKFYDAIKL